MNLKEVALRAGVSTATVSRVLNNTIKVNSATRTRVMQAVSELNYHPNIHARTLAGGKSQTLGMIVSNLENPFFLDIHRTLERDALQHGYEVVIANTDYSPDQLVSAVRMMLGRRVAGLAVIVSEMTDELVTELADSNIPLVFYDVPTPPENIINIHINYRRGIERVVDYLHSLGHTRFAFLGHHSRLAPIGEREKTFVAAVSKFAPASQWRVVTNQDGLEGGRKAAREMLASGLRPTALVCVNDLMAMGALRELRERGLRVPQDISVTGFDNIELSEFCYPSLTTVDISRERIGHYVFDHLVPEAARSKANGREILIDPEFIVRESTGTAPRL